MFMRCHLLEIKSVTLTCCFKFKAVTVMISNDNFRKSSSDKSASDIKSDKVVHLVSSVKFEEGGRGRYN